MAPCQGLLRRYSITNISEKFLLGLGGGGLQNEYINQWFLDSEYACTHRLDAYVLLCELPFQSL